MHTTLGTTRLHLLLALGAALTGTTYGLAVALVVLCVTGLRLWTRDHIVRDAGSAAVRAPVLAAAQHAEVLETAGGPRHRLAG